jgi:hypothetical protein
LKPPNLHLICFFSCHVWIPGSFPSSDFQLDLPVRRPRFCKPKQRSWRRCNIRQMSWGFINKHSSTFVVDA